LGDKSTTVSARPEEGRDETAARIQKLRQRLAKLPPLKTSEWLPGPAHFLPVADGLPFKTTFASETQRAAQWELAAGPAVKLRIHEEGWYRVGWSELLAAGLPRNANPRSLRLFLNGQEHAIALSGMGDGPPGPDASIGFYGTGQDTPWTDEQTYWLVAGSTPGKRTRMPQETRFASNVATSFPATFEHKDRSVCFISLKNGEMENFFGPVITAEGVDYLLISPHLASPSSGSAILEVVLQGISTGRHSIGILLNNVGVGTAELEGQAHGAVTMSIPQARLLDGDNLLTLQNRGDQTGIAVVDLFRLTYWRRFAADDDLLRCTVPGGRQVTIDGFSTAAITAMDITSPVAPLRLPAAVQPRGTTNAITIKTLAEGQRTLLVFTENAVRQPAAITRNEPSTWHGAEHAADLAIIAHGAFLQAVEPLRALRESQGYSVALIHVEDLYDEFNFGSKSPWALRNFLRTAHAQWRRPPRFVLLVGNAGIDPRNHLGRGDTDFVPSRMIETAKMETVSDDWFADLDGDDAPEMAVGRLPVRTVQEARTVVSKIIGYERAETSDWTKRMLLVADNKATFDFARATSAIARLLPPTLRAQTVAPNWTSVTLARRMLLEELNKGALLVNYFGHGSQEMWAGEGLLTSRDARGLSNGLRPPFVVAMTCLNGFMLDPQTECLAEALLKAEHGGAVAIWASSGLTEPSEQTDVNRQLIRVLFDGQSRTLGEAIIAAKSASRDREVRRTWILFGDPSLRLK
jgi:hypothetical protein